MISNIRIYLQYTFSFLLGYLSNILQTDVGIAFLAFITLMAIYLILEALKMEVMAAI